MGQSFALSCSGSKDFLWRWDLRWIVSRVFLRGDDRRVHLLPPGEATPGQARELKGSGGSETLEGSGWHVIQMCWRGLGISCSWASINPPPPSLWQAACFSTCEVNDTRSLTLQSVHSIYFCFLLDGQQPSLLSHIDDCISSPAWSHRIQSTCWYQRLKQTPCL